MKSDQKVDTRACEFRKLRFDTYEQMWAEAQRIGAADRVGGLRCSGNWSAGQTFGHLATWIDYGFDGFPDTLRAPLWLKLLMPLIKHRFLNVGMRRGVYIPRVPGGTLGIEPLSVDEGLARLQRAWTRLLAAPPPHPSPIFGKISHQDWIKGNLRHAELHFGYLHP